MTDKNFLSPLRFSFQIKKLPTFTEFVQTVDFPGVTVGETAGMSNPFQRLVIPGEHMTFDKIIVTFKVDEYMKDYLEIFEWAQGLGKPTNYEQYAALANALPGSGDGPQVDGSLTVLDSEGKAKIQFTFIDMFPTNLSGFKFDYTLDSHEFITASVDFSYRQYTYTLL